MKVTAYVLQEFEIPTRQIKSLTKAAMKKWELKNADDVADDDIFNEAIASGLVECETDFKDARILW